MGDGIEDHRDADKKCRFCRRAKSSVPVGEKGYGCDHDDRPDQDCDRTALPSQHPESRESDTKGRK